MKAIRYTLTIGMMFVLLNVKAQDYHFSQFDAVQVRLNPALTGVFDDDLYFRAATQYRNQWRPLATKPFSTFTMGYDMPIDDRWSIGGYLINYDGAKVYNEFDFVVSGSYKITEPNTEHFLSTGLQIGLIYKRINDMDLTFDNQYDAGDFNPELPSREAFQRFSKVVPEFNFGFFYKYLGWEQIDPYVGFTLMHISSPKDEFVEGEGEQARLPRRWVAHGGASYRINEEFTLDPKFNLMWQGQASEYQFGFQADYLVSAEKETAIQAGAFYRLDDAAIIGVGVRYRDITYFMSYDITTSGLGEFNGRKGGVEFSLRYGMGR